MNLFAVSAAQARPNFRLGQHLNEIGLLGVIVLLYVLFGTATSGFLSFENQMNILRDASAIGIAAWGATMIIIAGEIDVSVGPMVAFVSVIFAYLLRFGVPLAAATGLALILGAALEGYESCTKPS
jgi:ribose/xylose/arabinose/galactoside ABC-type transport system permease subunit